MRRGAGATTRGAGPPGAERLGRVSCVERHTSSGTFSIRNAVRRLLVRLQAQARLGVRGIAAHGLAVGLGCRGRIPAHEQDVPPEHVHAGRAREQLLVEVEERESASSK